MRHRHFGAALAAALALSCALPAHADYTAQDANKQPITLRSLIINGVHHPLHALCVMFGGNCVPASGDAQGNLGVNVQSSALPTGAATAANQTSALTKLDTLHTDLAAGATAAAQATGNGSLSSIDGKLTGAATAANQSAANAKLDTLHTDLAAAATAANQATGNTSLGSIDTKLTGVATAANQTSANTKLDTLHTDLAAGATAAAQVTGNASLSSIDGKLTGAATAANQSSALTKLDQLHTDNGVSGTGITQPTGGSGVFGWLSGIYNKLVNGTVNVNCTGCSGGGSASVGTNGSAAPTSSNLTGYVNGSGNLTADSPTNPHPVTDAALLAAINGTLNFGSTETGGTTGSAGTFATVLAANSARHGCLIQNTSATDKILVYFGLLGSATTTNALQVKAGDSISCSAGTIVLPDAVNIAGQASSSDTYVVVVQ